MGWNWVVALPGCLFVTRDHSKQPAPITTDTNHTAELISSRNKCAYKTSLSRFHFYPRPMGCNVSPVNSNSILSSQSK
jgi:hypothetical protein